MPLSSTFLEAAFGPDTDEVLLLIGTISHDELEDDLHVVNDLEPITSNDVTYEACPFEVVLPSDTDEGPPMATVEIENVSSDIIDSLREIDTAATIRMQVILASDPNTVEMDYGTMQLLNVLADAGTIRGNIGLKDIRLEAFPADSFGPNFFPALY